MTASSIAQPSFSSPADATVALRVRGRATGALVMSFFGAWWAASGLVPAHAPAWAWAALSTGVLALGAAAVAVLRRHPRPAAQALPAELADRQRRLGRWFLAIFLAEGLGIFLAINAVTLLGHPQWQPAAMMTVVGLHFLPLTWVFAYRPHAVTGAALTAWALAYPSLLADGGLAPAGMLGAAAILFASAAWALRTCR